MVQHPKWLTKTGQRQEGQTAADVIEFIRRHPAAGALTSDLGEALIQIYGRSAELLIERINQLPENYFRAFLNSAGVDRLPPGPARTELTFTLPVAEDGPTFVLVPKGTQAATQQTETAPEVVFETEDELVVTPNRLTNCITFDTLKYSNLTAQANATEVGAPFMLFEGTDERERIFFLGDQFFSYPKDDAVAGQASLANSAAANDEVSDFVRQHTVLKLCFTLVEPDPDEPPAPHDWELEWLYWDAEQETPGWVPLEQFLFDVRQDLVGDLDALDGGQVGSILAAGQFTGDPIILDAADRGLGENGEICKADYTAFV